MKAHTWFVFLIASLACPQTSAAQIARQKFDFWANFRVENGIAIWQSTYQRPGLTRDSVRRLVMSVTRNNQSFTLINEDGDELTFDIVNFRIPREGFLYKGKMIVDLKPEKYRVTLKAIQIKGADPQSALQDDKKYFKNRKLQLLEELSKQFLEAFDFKYAKPEKTVKKDW